MSCKERRNSKNSRACGLRSLKLQVKICNGQPKKEPAVVSVECENVLLANGRIINEPAIDTMIFLTLSEDKDVVAD